MIVSIISFMKLKIIITSQTITVKGQIDSKNHKTDFLLIEKVNVVINTPNGTINKKTLQPI